MKKILLDLASVLCLLPAVSYAQTDRVWATYYGGPSTEIEMSVATDPAGNVYLAGTTVSLSGIASTGSFQNTLGGGTDLFLAKFNSTGTRLWATYYGGTGNEHKTGMAIDTSGNIYISGQTDATTGVATTGSHQATFGGGTYDAFLVKFNSAGDRVWATYYGGTQNEIGFGVSTDASGNVYMSGQSNSTSGISTTGSFQTACNGCSLFLSDAFLVKFNSAGSRLWATYYGGTDNDYGYGVAADASGNVYLAGYTFSTSGISSTGAFKTTFGGVRDAFLVKFSSSGSRLWGTYYGGTGDDVGYSIATEGSANVYLAGLTTSTSGIATTGSFQAAFGGGSFDAFLVKFNSAGSRVWGTYYGGADKEEQYNVVTDNAGNVFLAGDSYSSSGIASGGYQNNKVGIENTFVAKFSSGGTRLSATYYGQGPGDDEDGHAAVDLSGNVYLAGYTGSTSGIATTGAHQTSFQGIVDAFLVKFGSGTILPVELISFAGWNEGKNNLLNWTTASEINCDYFNIEQSIDGDQFKTIGTIKGAGNSVQTISYSFVDSNPVYGINYYRLRQVDYDGGFNYSQIIDVRSKPTGIDCFIYEDETTGNFILTCPESENLQAQIFSIEGRILKAINLTNSAANKIDLAGFSNGVYILSISNGENIQNFKLIKNYPHQGN